jgi:hypothetical protein
MGKACNDRGSRQRGLGVGGRLRNIACPERPAVHGLRWETWCEPRWGKGARAGIHVGGLAVRARGLSRSELVNDFNCKHCRLLQRGVATASGGWRLLPTAQAGGAGAGESGGTSNALKIPIRIGSVFRELAARSPIEMPGLLDRPVKPDDDNLEIIVGSWLTSKAATRRPHLRAST